MAIAAMFLEFCEQYQNDSQKNKDFAREFLDFFDLDLENSLDEQLFNEYVKKAFTKLNTNVFKSNPYFINVQPKEKLLGNYELYYQTFAPYKPFIYNDVTVNETTFAEYSSLGYFEEEFKYLTLAKDNVIWMSITPNEIKTMQKSVEEAHGKVLTFGLGLGYYAYMVSIKPDVDKLVIVESDANIIEIFKKNILPFFPYSQKIEIVKEDAFKYLNRVDINKEFDYAFFDIWHSPEDGLLSYLKIKSYEQNKRCQFSYWLEDSLIAMLRRLMLILFDEQLDKNNKHNYQKAKTEQDKIINALYEATKDMEFATFSELKEFLKTSSLKKFIDKKGLKL